VRKANPPDQFRHPTVFQTEGETMNLNFAYAAPLFVALALGAPAADAAPKSHPARACFHPSEINGFHASDDQHVYVRVGVKDIYEFKLFGSCPDIDWTEHLGLISRGGGFICSGLDADLLVPSPIGPQRCPVRDIRKLSPAELAALPPKSRP
jgi:hypothetical protein